MGQVNFLGIVMVCVGAVLLFAPLGVVLITAAKSGRGRVLAWAFGASLAAATVWLLVAAGLRAMVSAPVAGWWLLSAPWASAMAAVFGWRRSLRAEGRAEVKPATGLDSGC